MPTNLAPIGVFDSGVGGLTVVAALRRALPHETIVYLGDTARVPYGTKSSVVVRKYAVNCTRFLAEQGAKLVVVACNTAASHGLTHLQETMAMPVLGVIEPGALAAAAASKTGRIGVIGTEGTIASGSYQRTLARLAPHAQVWVAACPLFVPLAEEGMASHAATKLIAHEYLAPLLDQGVDTVVLGCTHYPLLRALLQEVVGEHVALIDSAHAVAESVTVALQAGGLQTLVRQAPDRFFATDVSERLQRVGNAFLGATMDAVELVDLRSD